MPARYTTAPLADGAHTFDVRATDPAGNVDPTPATRSWTITARRYTDVIAGTRGLLGLWPLGDAGGRAADLGRATAGRYRGGPARAGALIRARIGRRPPVRRPDDRVKLPPAAIGKPRAVTVELWLERAARGGGAQARSLVTDARRPLADGFTLYLDARHRPVFALGGKRGRRASLTGPALQERPDLPPGGLLRRQSARVCT